MKGTTEEIIRFIDRINYKKISSGVLRKAKYCILDGIGAALAGISEKAVGILRDHIRRQDAIKEVSPLGYRWKTSPPLAALLNGVSMHVVDFDDVSWTMVGHPTAVTLPAALAAGGKQNASGKDLLTAYTTGCEVVCKLGKIVNPTLYRKGFHSTSTIGIFGATASAGWLLQLTAVQLKWAFGIAASCSSGLRGNFGTMVKSFQVGKANESGVQAAMLAIQGFQAADDIIENEFGFSRVMGDCSDIDELNEKLGNPFDLESPGVVLKQYPSCAGTHAALDALFELKNKYNLKPEQIASIQCKTDQQTIDMLKYQKPKTPLQGKFSMPYCLSVALVDGKVTLDHFSENSIKNYRFQSLIPKIRLILDKEIAAGGYSSKSAAKIKIRLVNGKELECYKKIPKGNPENPLSEDEIIRKFYNCTEKILSEKKIQQAIDAILHLERVKDITNLLKIFS